MQYMCDMDIIKTSFPAQSLAKLISDVAKETALMWEDPEFLNVVTDAFSDGIKKDHFIADQGVMILDALIPQLERPVHMLYKMPDKINFSENKGMKAVDLVFVLLSPKNDGPLHLRRLSRITRLFHDHYFCERIRHLDESDSIRLQFIYPDVQEKAA